MNTLALTDREREIVALIAQGLPQKDIAVRLHIAHRTVEDHVFRAKVRTGTHSCSELVQVWNEYLEGER